MKSFLMNSARKLGKCSLEYAVGTDIVRLLVEYAFCLTNGIKSDKNNSNFSINCSLIS